MTPTHPLRFANEEIAARYKESIRRQQNDVLAQSLRRVAATVEQEIMFQRRGLPATVPSWAREIADDKTVTNLRTLLKGAYLSAMIADERHATAHQQPRLYCSCCIAKEVTGRSEWTIAY